MQYGLAVGYFCGVIEFVRGKAIFFGVDISGFKLLFFF